MSDYHLPKQESADSGALEHRPSRPHVEAPDGPLSRRFHEPDSESVDGPLSRRFGDLPPRARRFSEPPLSDAPISLGPLSLRSTDMDSGAPPPSRGPASLNFARFAGEAGPGYRVREGADSLHVKLDGASVSSALRVVRVSPVALWLAAGGHSLDQLRGAYGIRFLVLGREVGPFPAFVLSVDTVAGEEIVGVKLGSVSLQAGCEIIELIHELVRQGIAEPARSLCLAKEVIDDKDRIGNLVGALMSTSGLGVLRAVDAAARIERIARDDSGQELIYWKAPDHWGEPPYVIDMAGYNSIHHLTFESYTAQGGRVVTPMPTRVERVRHRWYRRCAVRAVITVKYNHPLWPELSVLGRRVRDISYAGLCFETVLLEDLAFPGLDLPDLEVELDGEAPIHMQGQVRIVSLGKDGEPPLAGMMVTPRSADDERAWLNLVAKEMHATTQSGVEWSESIWSLFESSGYFNLSGKSPDQFNPLKASFMTFGQRAASLPQLLCQAVWPSQRGVEASLSLLKAYQGSWLAHQLAKRAGRPPEAVDPRQILRDIYVRAFEHPQGDPQFRWIVAHVEGRVPWIQKAHVDFAKKHASTGLTMALPFQLMEVMSSPRPQAGGGDVDVGPASHAEIEQFLSIIRAGRPDAYVDSLDLTEDWFDLWGVRQMWVEAGFERERALLVARVNGSAVAGALVEAGETGTNLFRLLDGVRFYSFVPGGATASFAALLAGVQAWYGARKKPSFMLFKEDSDLHISGVELRDLGDGYFWALSAMLLPEFLEHIYELTAPRRR